MIQDGMLHKYKINQSGDGIQLMLQQEIIQCILVATLLWILMQTQVTYSLTLVMTQLVKLLEIQKQQMELKNLWLKI